MFNKRLAQVAGCDIHYLDSQTGHGAGGLRVDEQVFKALAATYRVIAPSLPGFDESSPGATASVLDVADVLAAFIRQVVGGPAAVVGESFGGNVASWLAIRHPDVVDRLILAAPAGLRQAGGPELSQLSPREVSVLLFGRPPDQPPTPDEIERRNRNRANVGRLSHGRPAFDLELQSRLSDIQAPTLVLWGTADKMIFPEQAHHFEQHIPNVRLIYLEGGPHVLSAAMPDQFLPPVLEFLAQPAGVS
jgi:pimeloyl-ACP methyl ester carboxylesterase